MRLKPFIKSNLKFLLLLAVSVGIFFIFSPYSFIDWPNLYKSMVFESSVVTGVKKVTYTLQFTNTIPYIFQIKNLFWLMGPVMIISLIGFVKLIADYFQKKDNKLLLLFSLSLSSSEWTFFS